MAFTLKNINALQLMSTKEDINSGVCIEPINGGMSVGGNVDITGGLSVSTTTITGGTITDSGGTINFSGTSILLTTNDITVASGSINVGNTIIEDTNITTTAGILSITGSSGVSLYGGVSINGLVFPSSDGSANQVITTDGSGNLSFTDQSGGGGGGGVTTLGGLSDAYVVESEYNAILGTSPTGITGNFNTGVGISTLFSITTGTENTAMGAQAARSLVSGNKNIAIGSSALVTDVGGNETTAIGFRALQNQFFTPNPNTDTFNTAVGSRAGYQLTSGTSCTFIGASSGGGVITGTNLTCLGFGSQPSTLNATNEVTLGNPNITSLRCADTTIASLSDARDKNDIRDSTYGLNFLENVRPVEFTWDRRVLTPDDENDPKQGKRRVGFVAQELLEASGEDGNEILDLVYTANPQRLEAKYGNLIPVMVKAIQDLKTEVDTIKEHINLE